MELINFLELLSGKALNKKYDKNPAMRIQRIQNIHLALQFLEREMDVKLVGIGAEGAAASERVAHAACACGDAARFRQRARALALARSQTLSTRRPS